MSTRELQSLTGQRSVHQKRVTTSRSHPPVQRIQQRNQGNESAPGFQIAVQDPVPRSEIEVQLPDPSVPLPSTLTTALHKESVE